MTQKEYNNEYYRRWRKENREHLKRYHAKRRERIRRETPPEQRQYLTAFRESKGMTKTKFAKAVGVSDSYVSNMEVGWARICHDKIRAAFPDYKGGNAE